MRLPLGRIVPCTDHTREQTRHIAIGDRDKLNE